MDTAWRWGREEGCVGCLAVGHYSPLGKNAVIFCGIGVLCPQPAAAQGLEEKISQRPRAALATGGCFLRRQRAGGPCIAMGETC